MDTQETFVIAIDGPAASGKGTLARKLAEELNFAYMDTGLLYRGVAFEVISQGLSIKDTKDVKDAAQLLLKKVMNGTDKTLSNPTIRDDKTGQEASKVAAMKEVREVLNKLQRDFAQNPGKGVNGAILDGRDIGTIICPNAHLKLFITAKIDVRAKRRLKELQSRGLNVTYTDVLEDMRERDSRDIGRKDAPMAVADDAILIDTSDLDVQQSFEKVLNIAKTRLKL